MSPGVCSLQTYRHATPHRAHSVTCYFPTGQPSDDKCSPCRRRSPFRSGPTYAPLRSDSVRSCTVESAHPYQPGEDCLWSISVEGAETVEVCVPAGYLYPCSSTPRGGSRLVVLAFRRRPPPVPLLPPA